MTRFWKILGRSIRLRCPRCGIQPVYFRGFRMRLACEHCGCDFQREPGFYLGAIYFNYGLTALLITIGYPLLLFSGAMASRTALWLMLAVAVLVPLLFFRHARSLWLGMDEFWDPRDA